MRFERREEAMRAERSARSAAYILMADKLIELIVAAPLAQAEA